ncbi:NIPSNAP family protein [Paraburkholderia sartisoli]|uniref:NIPSNAP protein n=1 Tax=Paraburkholderia sartisoli TaxID=83784 RepID=A0A1H4H6U2_9BURK|nr:NIPSNAP family protein [Paraburkholderia sartisoli]SEB16808.1 NIPSNAP protein [Paraburkholderia sartisoli]
MLIEHRSYTLRPGAADLFWDAQRERGDDGLQPILERLIGSFATCTGSLDQIVSLYRYDSFDDWQTRLLGLYGRAELQAYFERVRPLIVRQESRFLVPAPLPELTPHWGNGHDWLASQGPLFSAPRRAGVVEETTLDFAAGGVPACWNAFRQHALAEDPAAMEGLFGGFSSVVGALNQVLLYRFFPDVEAWSSHRVALQASAKWNSFMHGIAPLTACSNRQLLAPSRIGDMSPMFGDRDADQSRERR